MGERHTLPALALLDAARHSFQLELVDPTTSGLPLILGDEGAAALGVALQSLPAPLTLHGIHLDGSELSPVGMAALAEGLARGVDTVKLLVVSMNDNPALGETGVAALLSAITLHASSLAELHLANCGLDDGAMLRLAAALPGLQRLEQLECGFNPAICDAGWAALHSALLQMPALLQLDLEGCTGLSDAGAAEVAMGVRGAGGLRTLSLHGCCGQLSLVGLRALQSAQRSHLTIMGVPGLQDKVSEALVEAALSGLEQAKGGADDALAKARALLLHHQ